MSNWSRIACDSPEDTTRHARPAQDTRIKVPHDTARCRSQDAVRGACLVVSRSSLRPSSVHFLVLALRQLGTRCTACMHGLFIIIVLLKPNTYFSILRIRSRQYIQTRRTVRPCPPAPCSTRTRPFLAARRSWMRKAVRMLSVSHAPHDAVL